MKGRFITSGIDIVSNRNNSGANYSTFNSSDIGDYPLYGNPNESGSTKHIVAKESGGNYRAFNPNGGGEGAVGKYQFRWALHKDKIRKYANNPNLSREEFRNNPQLQDGFYENYWRPRELVPQARQLSRNFNNIPIENLERLIHFRGQQGAEDYLRGNVSDKPESYNMSISKYTGINRVQSIPKFNLGGVISAYSSIAKPLGDLIEGDGTSIVKSSLSGLLQGGVVGAITKGLSANKEYNLQKRQNSVNRHNFYRNSDLAYSTLNNEPTNYYAKGGQLTPEYEAEKKEVVIGNPKLEEGQEIAPNIHKVGGKPHSEGGTMGQGGEFVFSNQLSIGNQGLQILDSLKIKVDKDITFAEAVELIAKKKRAFSYSSSKFRENNTNKIMNMRLDEAIKNLGLLQENNK